MTHSKKVGDQEHDSMSAADQATDSHSQTAKATKCEEHQDVDKRTQPSQVSPNGGMTKTKTASTTVKMTEDEKDAKLVHTTRIYAEEIKEAELERMIRLLGMIGYLPNTSPSVFEVMVGKWVAVNIESPPLPHLPNTPNFERPYHIGVSTLDNKSIFDFAKRKAAALKSGVDLDMYENIDIRCHHYTITSNDPKMDKYVRRSYRATMAEVHVGSKEDMVSMIDAHLKDDAPFIAIFHAGDSVDIRLWKELNISAEPLWTVDTARLAIVSGKGFRKGKGLRELYHDLKQDHTPSFEGKAPFHIAGHDSFFTLKSLAMILAAGIRNADWVLGAKGEEEYGELREVAHRLLNQPERRAILASLDAVGERQLAELKLRGDQCKNLDEEPQRPPDATGKRKRNEESDDEGEGGGAERAERGKPLKKKRKTEENDNFRLIPCLEVADKDFNDILNH